jgi:hypothetical protein
MIGQAAAFAGVTVKTVRHYHRLSLVDEPRRDTSVTGSPPRPGGLTSHHHQLMARHSYFDVLRIGRGTGVDEAEHTPGRSRMPPYGPP